MQKLVGNIPPVSTELLQTLLKIKTLTKDFKTYIPDFKDRVRLLAYIGTVGGPCGCAPTCPVQSAPSHSGLAVVLVDPVVRQTVGLSRQGRGGGSHAFAHKLQRGLSEAKLVQR